MALGKALFEGWHRFLTAFVPDHQQRLLVLLRQECAEEMCNVEQLTQHAQRMHYPHFRERLLHLAREDQVHVQWLREHILAEGEDLPAVACPPPRQGKNSWECLRLALEAEKRSCGTLLACIHQADRTNPALGAALRRWRVRKKQHCDEITNMLMKSDPYALPPPLTSYQEQQRQDWLAQQKSAWLDQERVRWEAEGRRVPWAEWVGEQEFHWTAELPNRELEWTLRQNEKDTEALRTATERTSVQVWEPVERRSRVAILPAYHTT